MTSHGLLIVIIYTEILYKYGGSLRKITMFLIIYIIFIYQNIIYEKGELI
nr:MAG TPA: hypothetical protein [Caudoviricetes sp.]